MKNKTFLLLILLLMFRPIQAQQVEYIDDEECGCSLVFVDGIQTTQNGNRFGFKRADGTVIAENIYLYVDRFHGNFCKVYLEERKCGMINRDGQIVVPCEYDDMEYPTCDRVMVTRNGRYGYCDLSGHETIAVQFLSASSFSEGKAQVLVEIDSITAACTFIDTAGNHLFPLIFENAMPFHEGYAPVMQYQRWGIIDTSGHQVLPCMYEIITPTGDGHFFAGDVYGIALFDYSFKPLSDFIYNEVGPIRDERMMVTRDGLYGFVDRRGREVVPCIYDAVSEFYMGRAMVRFDKRYGIIDTTGRFVLQPNYESTTYHGYKYVYRDSLAMVEKDHKIGFVDLNGNLAIPMLFEDAYHFTQGLACVKYQGRWGYINTKGEIYIPFFFDYASPFEWGRAEVIYNGVVSNIDRRGKCVKNCNGIIAWRDWTEE